MKKKLIIMLVILALAAGFMFFPRSIENVMGLDLASSDVTEIDYSKNGKDKIVNPRKDETILAGLDELKCRRKVMFPDIVNIKTGLYTIYITDENTSIWLSFDEEGNMYRTGKYITHQYVVNDKEFYKVLKEKFK